MQTKVEETLEEALGQRAALHTSSSALWLRQAIQARLRGWLSSFPSRVFFITGAGYLLLTWFFYAAMSHQPPATLDHPASWATIITIPWRRYDSRFFLHIAQYGYDSAYALPSFFPLYPLLISIVAWPLGNHFTAAALLVSWLCAWGSYCWFYRLAEREYGKRAAQLALIFLACCPVSFFNFAPYSESLFLLVSIGAVERARAGRLWQAGLLSALGMLARPTGILLLIPLGWECGRRTPEVARFANRVKQRGVRFAVRLSAPQALTAQNFALQEPAPLSRLAILSLGLTPLALLGYSLVLKLALNNPLAFLSSEDDIWHRQLTMPWQTVGLFVIAFQRAAQAGDIRLYIFNTVDLLLVLPLPALVLYYAVRGRLWWGAALYQLAITLLLVAVPTHPSHLPYEVLLSTQRLLLPAFPIFLLVGQLGVARPRLYRVLLVLSIIVLIVYTLRFMCNLFVA
jgi:hypothetical protein